MVPNTPEASKMKAPPDLGQIILVHLKQPPPSPTRVITNGYGQHYNSFQPLPFPHTRYSREEQHPNPPELQAHSITMPDNVLHLQEEMNDAMVHILTFRDSVDAHWQRLISEPEISHYQNETKASKVINGVEAHYAVALHDTEVST